MNPIIVFVEHSGGNARRASLEGRVRVRAVGRGQELRGSLEVQQRFVEHVEAPVRVSEAQVE